MTNKITDINHEPKLKTIIPPNYPDNPTSTDYIKWAQGLFKQNRHGSLCIECNTNPIGDEEVQHCNACAQTIRKKMSAAISFKDAKSKQTCLNDPEFVKLMNNLLLKAYYITAPKPTTKKSDTDEKD